MHINTFYRSETYLSNTKSFWQARELRFKDFLFPTYGMIKRDQRLENCLVDNKVTEGTLLLSLYNVGVNFYLAIELAQMMASWK